MAKESAATRVPYYLLIAIFSMLAAGILAASHIVYQGYEKHYRTEVERELSAVAELKKAELAHWRNERQGDAAFIFQNALFSGLASRFLDNPQDTEAEGQLLEWMRQYLKHRDYDQVRLLDPQGATRLSSPADRPPATAVVLRQVKEVLQSRRITFVDLYRNEHDQRIYLSVLIPILDPLADDQVIGVLALRVEPERHLYPFILHWPTPRETAETLLVRREGNEVLYLNDLKFIKDAALKHRQPLNRTDIPGVMAVLGRTGIVEGMDYRNEPVIADILAVPDSPWFLVTRMNISEVDAGVRGYFWITAGFVTALLLAAGSGLALVWRHQRIGFYQERYKAAESLQESEMRLQGILESTSDGILAVDNQGRVIKLNRRFADLWRIPQHILDSNADQVLLDFVIDQLCDPEAFIQKVRMLYETDAHDVDTLNFKDGRIFERYSTPLLLDGSITGRVWSFRDITEPKQAEEKILRSLKEKEVMLKEIHHRVKNNMQVIYSLLNLQAKGIADPAVRAIFEESRNRIMSMALIHENLYRSKDLAAIDFKVYLQSLVASIVNTYKRPDVVWSVDLGPIILDVNTGVPCGLLVNELVSNSLKHAFPGGRKGTIMVGLTKNRAGDHVLSVADNGIGFPAGVDFRNTPTLGMQLVTLLTGQIHGTLELAKAEEGTRFIITFPGESGNQGERYD